MNSFTKIDGGVTAPDGFIAAGVHAGLKARNLDLALLVSEKPAVSTGVFTTNKIQSATVKLNKRLLGKKARAIIINSGNANACTGLRGIKNAEQMAMITAECLGFEKDTVFVCSTGTIGVPMPMEKVKAGIKAVSTLLSGEGGNQAAKAIMTTDTVDKQVALEFNIDDVSVKLGGMAKGSGMIEPNMATMLAFLTTNANVDQCALKKCLFSAVNDSFNKISIDGDQSTNDTVLFLANGKADNKVLNKNHPDWNVFEEAVRIVTKDLAIKIVKDGEGVTKFVTVNIKGAKSKEDAYKGVRAVANSLLVKTSWYGEDPNWGRIIDALGYSGAEVEEDKIDISFDDICVVKNGCAFYDISQDGLKGVLSHKDFSVNININLGESMDTVYTCDCSPEYVRINSEYMT